MSIDETRAKALELALKLVKSEEASISRNGVGHFALSPQLFEATRDIYAFLTDGKDFTKQGQYLIYPAAKDKDTSDHT